MAGKDPAEPAPLIVLDTTEPILVDPSKSSNLYLYFFSEITTGNDLITDTMVLIKQNFHISHLFYQITKVLYAQIYIFLVSDL
jgi:hypothetical protein